MAIQKTPHTEPKTDVSEDAIDMETAENPQPWETGNAPSLDGNTDGAQMAGKRAFYATGTGLPKDVAAGTADLGADSFQLPKGSGTGITNAPADAERATQEKVVGK